MPQISLREMESLKIHTLNSVLETRNLLLILLHLLKYYWFYIATVNDTKSLYETSSGEYRTKTEHRWLLARSWNIMNL